MRDVGSPPAGVRQSSSATINPGASSTISRPSTVFSLEVVEARRGLCVLRVSDRGGARAEPLFRDEAGGHRWQRVPPNEKRDCVHTSTITVAVLPEPTEVEVRVAERDLEWS